MSRTLLVSNRLPITINTHDDGIAIVPSAGGLATGLWGPHQKNSGLWVGWPGDVSALSGRQREELGLRLSRLRTVPVYLSDEEHKRYYEGFANGVLWPLCHYLIDKVSIDSEDFGVYREVNERFADLVTEVYRPDDLIWIHDYHLMLLPAMIRERLPDARIGFFLHIPFPSSEVFRTLPWRSAILEGLLGADLVGFHTYSYMQHFAESLLRILGIEPRVDQLTYRGREVRLGAFPMGIDAETFAALADSRQVQDAAEAVRSEAHPRRLFVAIDRLDYTKGIPRRLLAFERLLELDPTLQDKVRLIQVAVPSRAGIGHYDTLRRQVEELVGHINGRFATPTAVPIHSMYRSLSREEVIALYRAADVMVVTPLRDGLNLVAKEFCASRTDEDGVLVLSELAGAAAEMGEALRVNPYDIDQVAQAFQQALEMTPDERRSRMRVLRQRVSDYNVHHWVRSFIESLESISAYEASPRAVPLPVEELIAKSQESSELQLFLDYDGTLAPFATFPSLAAPDRELCRLLEDLTQMEGTRVHLLSGRMRDDLEKWFAHLPIGLYAEHGLWMRPPGAKWELLADLNTEWKSQVLEMMQYYVTRTPGTFIEDKTASVAWHYRNADVEFGFLQANELRSHLVGTLSNLPVEVLKGEKVVEVRMQGVHKGAAVRWLLGQNPAGVVVAVGDDKTDEDMFAALPPDGYSVHVGASPTCARYYLPDWRAVRNLLRNLLDANAGPVGAAAQELRNEGSSLAGA